MTTVESLTEADIENLCIGDVVELHHASWPEGTVVHGPLYERGSGRLLCAGFTLRWAVGDPMEGVGDSWTVTVIERAPRLYINHRRTTPIAGDVVRDGEDRLWMFDHFGTWQGVESTCEESNRLTGMEQPLTLLVDGNTKKVVQ